MIPTFEEWANKVNNFQGDAASSLATFRKDITIEVYNTQGTKVLAYQRLPLLGLGVPGVAAAGCLWQCGDDHHHQARERGLGS